MRFAPSRLTTSVAGSTSHPGAVKRGTPRAFVRATSPCGEPDLAVGGHSVAAGDPARHTDDPARPESSRPAQQGAHRPSRATATAAAQAIDAVVRRRRRDGALTARVTWWVSTCVRTRSQVRCAPRAHPACSFDRGIRRRDDPRRPCRAIRVVRGAIRAVPAEERAAEEASRQPSARRPVNPSYRPIVRSRSLTTLATERRSQ